MIPTLDTLLPSLALSLRGEDSWVGQTNSVVVLLIDGLGWQNLAEQPNELAACKWLLAQPSVQSPLPSTTPVSLATFGMGMNPGHHGIVGATFEVPEFDHLLRPLSWATSPEPIAIQPEPTWFEQLGDLGIEVVRVGPGEYAQSGLTQAVLRGGEHRPAANLEELVSVIQGAVSHRRGPQLVYGYYAKLDKVGHVNGAQSDEWRAELAAVLTAIEQLRRILPASTQLIVTADHGMLDVGQRLWIEDRRELMDSVREIAGEPRLRHIYAQAGLESRLLANWQTLGEVADVYSRDEFVDRFWPNAEEFARQRVGDVVAICRDGVVLGSRKFDSRVSLLAGLHGGATEVERAIPMALLAG